MKRYAPWLLVAFILALLLTLGLCADQPTHVFLDSTIGRASYLVVSLLSLVPAVAVMVSAVKPGKFWLHLEEDVFDGIYTAKYVQTGYAIILSIVICAIYKTVLGAGVNKVDTRTRCKETVETIAYLRRYIHQ